MERGELKLFGRLGLALVLACLAGPGCLYSSVGGYRTPEAVQEGSWKMGLAAGGGYDLCYENRCFIGAEAQAFADVGLSDRRDLRLRLTAYTEMQMVRETVASPITYESPYYVQFGPGLEHKWSLGDHSAFFLGTDALFLFKLGDECILPKPEGPAGACPWNGSVSVAPYFGWVFAVGDPGHFRWLVNPTVRLHATQPGRAEVSLATGLDIPLGDSLAIRPEGGATCRAVFVDQSEFFCVIGFGTAVVF
jgi:hypothetical protein